MHIKNNFYCNRIGKKLTKSENIFYYTILVMLFQITRNISTIGYVAILFTLYFALYITYFIENKDKIYYKLRIIPILFIFSLFWIPVISLNNIGMDEFVIAFPRFMITFPFILICFLYKLYNKRFIIKVLKLYCNFMTLASLSIPYQIVFGEIFFFSKSSFRAGVERYASLAGNLTALGSFGAISLIFLLFSGNELYSKKKKVILIIITTLSMLMTLQKSALVNIIICYILYFLFNSNTKFYKKLSISIGMTFIMFIVYYLIKDTILGIYINNIFSYSFTDSSIGIKQDLISRFWNLPSRVVEFNNMKIIDLILGIGFSALAGTMGLPSYPMAHNNYFDLIFSGGIIHFVTYLILLLSIPYGMFVKRIKGLKITNIDLMYSMAIFVVLINMLIGAVSFYQPVFSVVAFFMICSYNKIKYQNI